MILNISINLRFSIVKTVCRTDTFLNANSSHITLQSQYKIAGIQNWDYLAQQTNSCTCACTNLVFDPLNELNAMNFAATGYVATALYKVSINIQRSIDKGVNIVEEQRDKINYENKEITTLNEKVDDDVKLD